jgi:predicted PurR-regulated permease PerM
MKFKIYVGIMLFIIAAASVITAVVIVYGGIKLKDQANNITNKVNNFTSQVNDINKGLQGVSQTLQSTNSQLQKQASAIPTSIPNL